MYETVETREEMNKVACTEGRHEIPGGYPGIFLISFSKYLNKLRCLNLLQVFIENSNKRTDTWCNFSNRAITGSEPNETRTLLKKISRSCDHSTRNSNHLTWKRRSKYHVSSWILVCKFQNNGLKFLMFFAEFHQFLHNRWWIFACKRNKKNWKQSDSHLI